MTEIQDIPLSKIRALTRESGGPLNPRGPVTDSLDLQSSFRDVGQLSPIQVFKDGGLYYLLDGHRRVAAARALKMKTIRAEIVSQPANSTSALRLMLAYDTHQPLPPSRKGANLALLMSEGFSVEQIARLVGLKPGEVKDLIDLALAPPSVRAQVDNGKISWRVWRKLRILPKVKQVELADEDEPVSLSKVKRLLAQQGGGAARAGETAPSDLESLPGEGGQNAEDDGALALANRLRVRVLGGDPSHPIDQARLVHILQQIAHYVENSYTQPQSETEEEPEDVD